MNKQAIHLIVNNYLNNDSRLFRHAKIIKKLYTPIFLAKTHSSSYKLYYKSNIDSFKVYRFYYKFINYNIPIKHKKNIFFKILWYIKYLSREIFNQYIMYKVLINLSPSFIIANDFDTLIPTCLYKIIKRKKIIYDSHELWIERNEQFSGSLNIRKKIEFLLEKFFIKKCNAVITVSERIAEELSKRYNIKKPFVIRNLDTIKPLINENERIQLRKNIGIPENAVLIVYQGGLTDIRGIPELIQAMNNLNNNIHLLLMGKFLSNENKEKIKNNNRIHYIGMIEQEELHKYTCIGDIGIHPMRIDNILNHKLALPNKFSQYMNAGLCLVLYKTPESERLIEESKAGVVFESGNSDNIVKAINSIIESGKLQEYKKNSREYFLKNFNWDIEKYKLLHIIKSVEKSS